MKFDLTHPCSNCPFRSDVHPFIDRDRVREILGDPDARGAAAFPAVSFACHKTVDYDGADDGRIIDASQHCAGVALILLRDGRPNQAMQLAERLLDWKSDSLDLGAPVYADRRSCIAAHRERKRR